MAMHRFSLMIVASALALGSMFLTSTAEAQQAFVSHRTSLRAGPDRGYPQVAWVHSGAGVYVNGCVNGYYWCDVTAGGIRGWVSARHLTYAYQDRRVLIYGNGLAFGAPLIGFTLGSYWDNHYRDRVWYQHHTYWDGWRPGTVAPRHWYGDGYARDSARYYGESRPVHVAPRVIHPGYALGVRPQHNHVHRERIPHHPRHDSHRSAGSAVFLAPR
jgi:uncharacterized protein YraI